MNIHNLWELADYFSFSGHTLSNEQICMLQNSLVLLQNDSHFSSMYFWGKIFGIDNDYFIAFGFQKDALRDRKYFYSTDLNEWGLLPISRKKWKKLTLLATNRFQGDPTLRTTIIDELLEENSYNKRKILKEEDRIAAIVYIISDECEIKARGQLIKLPDGFIVENQNFYGLTYSESKQIKSYVHYRPAQHRWNTLLLTRADYNYSMDFLDTIDIDIPAGCWSLAFDRGQTVVYLKNLYWPGMLYFHKPKTPDAGWIYIGNGRKCLDVPFMI